MIESFINTKFRKSLTHDKTSWVCNVFHQAHNAIDVNSFKAHHVQSTLVLLIEIIMRKKYSLAIIFLVLAVCSFAQHPFTHWTDAMEIRYDSKQPIINYVVIVDSTDTSSFSIEIRIQNIPDTFHVAMVTHPEYDDQYWRYVENFFVETKKGKGNIVREDSALWKIITNGRKAVLHYRIHFPVLNDAFRSAWKAYLTSTGAINLANINRTNFHIGSQNIFCFISKYFNG